MVEVFDNKFGNIVVDNRYGKSTIDGVDKDAEIVTNSNGGMQSKSPMAMHLLDPDFLYNTVSSVDSQSARAIKDIALYMGTGDETLLYRAIECLCGKLTAIVEIAKVLQYGATMGNSGKGYPVNNWRLIPREDHINHALIHIIADMAGDTQDEHIPHALCRIMMAIATKESSVFCYNKYVDTKF